MNIFYIEDDEDNAEYWINCLAEDVPEANVMHFTDPLLALQCAGSPDYIVFDVGSIGLMHEFERYYREYEKIRDRWPGSVIFLVSGWPSLAAAIREDSEDEMAIPCAGADWTDTLQDYLRHLIR